MIKMLRTVQGSPDGVSVYTYVEGQVYGPSTKPRTSESLEKVFIRADFAEKVGGEKRQDAGPESQVAEDDRETKVVDPRDETKDTEEADEKEPQFSLEGMTVGQVLQAVKDGKVTAQEALQQEHAGAKRATLLRALEDQVGRG